MDPFSITCTSHEGGSNSLEPKEVRRPQRGTEVHRHPFQTDSSFSGGIWTWVSPRNGPQMLVKNYTIPKDHKQPWVQSRGSRRWEFSPRVPCSGNLLGWL